MSLDVTLSLRGHSPESPLSGPRIFIREKGQTKEISRAEWDRRNPGREPVTADVQRPAEEVFDGNITHNLNCMAEEAGIYAALWRPEEVGITRARELILPLTGGLERLKADPERFKAYNPPNGWGSYEGLVQFVTDYLAACVQYPDADVYVSR